MRRGGRRRSPPDAEVAAGCRTGWLSDPASTVLPMAKSSAGQAFQCSECGWRTTKWSGRCAECQAWGTVQAAAAPRLVRPGSLGAALAWPAPAG